MFMVNTVNNGHLQGDALYTDGLLGGVAAKIWFFVGLLIGFGYIFIIKHMYSHHHFLVV